MPAIQPTPATLQHLKLYSRPDVTALTRLRRFETKLGERIQVLKAGDDLHAAISASNAKFVLLGIPEDIGTRGNDGHAGADTLWTPFLQSFLNIQSNEFLDGNEILLLGHFDFSDVLKLIDNTAANEDERTEAYRHAVNIIDEEVEKLVKIITSLGKMPVVVGGGHNNSYPIIKGAAKGWCKSGIIPLAQINCVNLDASVHYRPLEGRHSGNPFRYADEDGFLLKYCVVGVHENYLPQSVWMDMVDNPFIDCITFEDIFVHEKRSFLQAVAHATTFTKDSITGIDLDLGVVQHSLSTAMTPVGVSAIQARQYIAYTAADLRPAYLYISEGATRLPDGRSDGSSAKLVSYLVSDFVKASTQRQHAGATPKGQHRDG